MPCDVFTGAVGGRSSLGRHRCGGVPWVVVEEDGQVKGGYTEGLPELTGYQDSVRVEAWVLEDEMLCGFLGVPAPRAERVRCQVQVVQVCCQLGVTDAETSEGHV